MRHLFFAAALALGFAAHAGPPEWVAAKVVKVEPERSRVTLDHERVKSIDMEAMVMPFKVAKAVDLKPFKAGDKVRFRLANKDDHLVVEAMEKAR
ncbi:copper-binding protein [Caenimonas sedimenti]|uniref:Copper-binding protein n=1 Tax=Caenimonas sedimenti TaxID=2596921 RepID=A0A562ZXH6_9BURK|nr:copper-binding protein [Caenimonas sedimenti]TWO72995.1 copper-binding protein [Caenimonas sedimenti]